MSSMSSESASHSQGVTLTGSSPRNRKRPWSGDYTYHEFHSSDAPKLQHSDYTIGWICALHIEMAAARAVLDSIHKPLPLEAKDSNAYILGHIGLHNIVMACLPVSQYGMNNAANVASNMNRSFPSIRIRLMVGIGGGAPRSNVDLRLGDVVVGCRVMQYDMGKVIGDGQLLRTASQRITPPDHSAHVSRLRAIHETMPSRMPSILEEMHDKHPGMTKYKYPTSSPDRLFRAAYDHDPDAVDCSTCIQSNLVNQSPRTNRDPMIHHGGIASGNQVMKHGISRDEIAQKYDVICFEMEAAGLMDYFPCLVIRGICDYSDSHKNKQWQEYAAATAAAYTKELLQEIPSFRSVMPIARDTIPNADREYLINRREYVLSSLRFDQIASRQSNIEVAHEKTCNWLLEHPTYLEWLESEALTRHHGILWLSGKPGAGKSTIMKFVYTHLKEIEASTASASTVSFFFNARGELLEKSTTGMYRSLLLQLLETFPDLQRVFDDLTLIPKNQHACPTTATIQKLFHNAALMLNARALSCVIDALDECDEQQVRDMVGYFEELGRDAMKNSIQLRICFSSRHYPYIYSEHALRLTLEDQKGHSQDLEQYVKSRFKPNSNLFDDVQAQILHKAAGVFMWVVLVVNILNTEFDRGRIFAVRKRLQELPVGLSDLFKDILRRDNENMQELLLCIQWILFAKQPLRPEEFYFAVLSGLPDDSLLECDVSQVTSDIMKKFVISSSKGLAEVTKSWYPTVQFIHESIPDFLLKDGGLLELWPDLDANISSFSHDMLKQCCHAYFKLCIPSFSVDKPLSESEQAALIKKFPFLIYVISYMLDHANIAALGISQNAFLSQLALPHLVTLKSFIASRPNFRQTSDASLIYIFATEGLSNLIRTRPIQDLLFEAPGGDYWYSLFAALMNEHKDSVRALLGWDTCYAGEEDVMRALKSDVRYAIKRSQTPLHWAASSNREATVRQVLKKGADINARDCGGNTALLLSLSNGNEAIVKLLINKGADFNVENNYGDTVLSMAGRNGNEAIVKLLIDKGADVNFKDISGNTALGKAVHYQNEAIVKLLIDKGADVKFKDNYGDTALSMAVQNRNEAIIKLLIDKGADVNFKDISGNTALGKAVHYQNEAIVKLLIDKGADVNAENNYGSTALSMAVRNGNEAIVKLLIENGADTEDYSGCAAL